MHIFVKSALVCLSVTLIFSGFSSAVQNQPDHSWKYELKFRPQFHFSAGARPLTEFRPPLNTYEIDVTFEITDPEARFGLRLAKNGDLGISVGYEARTSSLFVDRSRPENGDFSEDFPKIVTAPLQRVEGTVRLHLFVDQSSVEVFGNDGEVARSALYFPEPESTDIELFAEQGSTIMKHFAAWELESIWGVEP